MHERDRVRVLEAVHLRMASFERAERSLDAVGLIEHFSTAGDFYMHHDGDRLGLDEVADGVRRAFPTLAALDGGFIDLDVQVLASDAALATARFRETITTADGATLRQRGAASWLWRLHDNEWTIAYGHVDHYPDSPEARA